MEDLQRLLLNRKGNDFEEQYSLPKHCRPISPRNLRACMGRFMTLILRDEDEKTIDADSERGYQGRLPSGCENLKRLSKANLASRSAVC
jgi:hypothetical protein